MRILVIPLVTLIVSGAWPREASGQSAPEMDSLVHALAKMQVAQDDFFFRGSFPVYRRYGRSGRLKADNDVFYTGLIAFTLRDIRDALSPWGRREADSVIRRAYVSYPYFQNTSGLPTYNFWRTDPPLIFPHAWLLNRFNTSQQLPDDLDDTVILWLSMQASDSVARLVKSLMDGHANGALGWIRNTYPYYRGLRAYSTWFGVRMPVDFDFAVLCNVLYFVKTYHLPFDVHDSASVDYLKGVIQRRQHLSRAAFVSPHYGRPPILLYHISRLLGRYSIPGLDSLKPALLADARMLYGQSTNWLDSVLLSTAILRLGGPPVPLPAYRQAAVDEPMPTFFVASFAAVMPGVLKKVLLPSQMIKYYFSCPAYRCALYLENLALRSGTGAGQVLGRAGRTAGG